MSVAVVDMRAPDADTAFVRTLQETGFAVLRNAPVDSRRLQRMSAQWLEFFLGDDKWNYPAVETASGNTSGYIPPEVSETAVGHHVKDLKEFFHITPETDLPAVLRDDAQAYLREALSLGSTLLGWIDEHCAAFLPESLRGRLGDCLSPSDSLMRLLHYPPLTGSESPDAVRAAAHEDINLLTVLPVSEEPGLQVLTQSGDWADVPGRFGDLIINSGDMLQEASGQRLPSTTHRVLNPTGDAAKRSRISMPYFLAPDLGIRLSDRYTAGEYLHERLDLLAR
ncbi:MAG: 2OG-Fe(II) oxygenase family protein [Congregibacter sp.]